MHRQIEAGAVINQAIVDHPETIKVFAKYGIDSCCGSAHTIEFATKTYKQDTQKVTGELYEVTTKEA